MNYKFNSKSYVKYTSPNANLVENPVFVDEVTTTNQNKLLKNLTAVFEQIPIKDGMTFSFHHHLRNGDYVINKVMAEAKKRNLKNITIAASGIFKIHEPLVPLLKDGTITMIYTNYLNGPVAEAISAGVLNNPIVMDTHGGRARAIQTGELKIDVAFIGVPTSDNQGNGTGAYGQSACGSLGYIIPDMLYAKNKVVLTDNLVNQVERPEIISKYIDYVVVLDQIGFKGGIISGITKPTKDPIQLKIARNTANLIVELGLLKDNFSMQTGAGGISLSVAAQLKDIMLEKKIKGSFASGGITSFLVNMLEEGLFEHLYDVQCFDLDAIKSYKNNERHLPLSSITYASPYGNPIINNLDVVILGASEIDKNFNVNVTTNSNNLIIGGSGGHSDTARAAKVTIITTNLVSARLPIIKDNITTITTPGETIDIVVTERGIAINPKRKDLIEKLKDSNLNFKTIDELINIANKITGTPQEVIKGEKIVGLIRYLDGSIIDKIYEKIR